MNTPLTRTLLGVALLLAAACDKPPADAAPTDATPADTAPAAPRPAGSVVLGGADIHTVQPGLIEAGIAISGGLRPIESVSVRARLEGDITEVMVREGEAVQAGATLARFDDVEAQAALRSAQADRLAAETDANTARWNLEQSRDLFEAGAIPERDYRGAEQASAAAAARLAAADARLRSAELVARDTRVTAPVSGIVERRMAERGMRALRGGELFVVVRTEVLELTAAVPARLADAVRRGQTVRFSADGRQIQGRVARVSPTIDPASQSVTVYVQVDNRDGALKGNAFATGQIIERALDDQLVIPQGGVRQAAGGGAPFVWRLVGGSLERAPVELGIVDESRGVVQVTRGLSAGDQVVVGNVGMLGAGMQVQVIGGEPSPGGR